MPALLLLTACASVPTSLLSPDSLYPESITACADEPKVPPRPAPDVARPPAVKATYTEKLHEAWGDCHDTVGATKVRKAEYKKQYDAATAPAWKKLFNFGKKD